MIFRDGRIVRSTNRSSATREIDGSLTEIWRFWQRERVLVRREYFVFAIVRTRTRVRML